MIHVSISDLRNLIFFKISETIIEYRKSKKDIFPYEETSFATEDEIDDFIKTIPYYDDELKNFLLWKHGASYQFVSENWFGRFYLAITYWYDSEEWMDYSPAMLANALLNYQDESISKLCMPYLYPDEPLI